MERRPFCRRAIRGGGTVCAGCSRITGPPAVPSSGLRLTHLPPRNDSLRHRETVLRDVAGAGVPNAILILVLDAMSNGLSQRTQAERLADDETVQRQRENQRLALGLFQHFL